MDDVTERADEAAEQQPVDFADDLDQLAVVEAELAAAEAELAALEDAGADPDPDAAS